MTASIFHIVYCLRNPENWFPFHHVLEMRLLKVKSQLESIFILLHLGLSEALFMNKST
jgi:hypothetical protein